MFVLVAHFRVPDPGPGIPSAAGEPLSLLAAAPECRRLRFAHSTEAADRFVLVAEFDSAADYRRALSPWPMRTLVVPWLSGAELTVSEVNEVLFAADAGKVRRWEPTVPEPGR